MITKLLPPTPLQLWAQSCTSVQLAWGALPHGPIELGASFGDGDTRQVRRLHPGGPGAMTIGDLPSATKIQLELSWEGGQGQFQTATLPAPPGEHLCRFATVSDLHLGAERFGLLKTMRDPTDHPVPHPLRCATAAVKEASDWGAEFLVIKGDAVNHEQPGNFAMLGHLVDRFPDLPMMLIPGNHDVDASGANIPLAIGKRELPYVRNIHAVQLRGINIVGVDTTVPGSGYGSAERIKGDLLDHLSAQSGPVFVALHHQLQQGRLPRYWPPGIRAPHSDLFLDAVDAQPVPVLVSSGHTHRNRSRLHGTTLVSEVASTKDWPGVWAAYDVYEGGITQTVRRIEHPPSAQWNEHSRGAVWGVWSMWSPGSRTDRSLTHTWQESGRWRLTSPAAAGGSRGA